MSIVLHEFEIELFVAVFKSLHSAADRTDLPRFWSTQELYPEQQL
jgi:hypothetical protein